MNIKKTAVLIIVFIAIAVTGALVFRSEYQPINVPDEPIISEEDKYEELTFPDNTLDTSDWEMYRNEEFGFEIRYPRGWKINAPLIHRGTAVSSFSESGYGGELRFFPDGIPSSDYLVFMRVRNISLENQIENVENSEMFPMAGVKEYIKVNNTVGIETKDFEGPGFYVYERYILEGQNNITYEFGELNEPNADKYKSEMEQMLLSFKLIK
ncbi:MAG: hypothetical protein COU90_03205 [Candidatus Ryanbacteria bacterium CG10_big_fil_rev_8_21_14_0_10_43_42]|uniref:PsbP C-terminal domain-containing protein n=1 Tax=Candidatus Ryanbacteria bacterium CG10_big_fil_rev_8_21_14_0_10_43_42 TaxID=1974864 RepID=A0A2M8KWX8_9BACT|nr:MAG: hypothetical protein COU90_03205 [Candidatus Ryanbacteria bacterium CG10_big_fil_rev_8_21_14_0_10_43_42]